MADVDKTKILDHLKARADQYPLLPAAVFDALATAIKRGDFDVEEAAR